MSDVRNVSMSEIRAPELPSRTAMDPMKLGELVESMRIHGLIQPVVLVQRAGYYEVVAGHRRYTAAQQLGWLEIRAIVFLADEIEWESVRLDENVVREELSPADEAVYVAELWRRYQLPVEDLAKLFHRSISWVDERYALITGNDEVFAALRDGQISLGVAHQLNRIEDKDTCRYYLRNCVAVGATIEQAKIWVNQALIQTAMPLLAPAPAGETAETPPIAEVAVKCAYCGGEKDPWNLESVFIHKWHLHELARMTAAMTGQKGGRHHGKPTEESVPGRKTGGADA